MEVLMALVQIEAGDRRLLEVMDGALAEAARRSGEWLVCRPGCTQCCLGPFAITQLDARRLRAGLSALDAADPARAQRVRQRAAAYATAAGGAPRDEDGLPVSMDDVACAALDPETGCCDLYEARPITCRAFGPAAKIGEDAVGACELCYTGATEEEQAACAVEMDPSGLEMELLAALDAEGVSGSTSVADALVN